MTENLEGRAKELLNGKNFCLVATLAPDGRAHVAPTWVAVEDGLVVLNSAEGRAWPENLRRDPRVTLTVLNHENPYEYVSVKGRVVEDTHEGADEMINALAKKYMDVDEYPFRQPGEQRVVFKVEPERVHHHGG